MPKSKVRKKVAVNTATSSTQANESAYTATRMHVAAPSGPIYIGIMLGLIVLGLVWAVVVMRKPRPQVDDDDDDDDDW